MKIKNIGEIIAERVLALKEGRVVKVSIGKPSKYPDSEDYYCPYQITGMGSKKINYAMGIDSVQAIDLAFKKIGAFLYTSEQAKAGELFWFDDKYLGFPFPESLCEGI